MDLQHYISQSIGYSCVHACPTNFFKSNNNLCVVASGCSPSVADPSTSSCVVECPTDLFADTNNVCVSAANCLPNVADPKTESCAQICPAGSFKNQANLCVIALACLPNVADPSTSACVGKCPDGSFKNSGNLCVETVACNPHQQIITNESGFWCDNLQFCINNFTKTCILWNESSVDCNATVTTSQNQLICVVQSFNLSQIEVLNIPTNGSSVLCDVLEISSFECGKTEKKSVWNNLERVPAGGRVFGGIGQQLLVCDVVLDAQMCGKECGWQFDVQNKKCLGVIIDGVNYE